VTAAQVVDALRRGGAAEADVEVFVRAVLANWMIGAPDAHAKNYSIFLTAEQVALAPLYDVSTGFGQEQPWPEMAMPIGDEKTFSGVMARHLARFAEAIGVKEEFVLTHGRILAEAMPMAFSMAAQTVDVDAAARAQLKTIEAQLDAHCERARAALGG
jgi:serine/threonine-protein kinase HipA